MILCPCTLKGFTYHIYAFLGQLCSWKVRASSFCDSRNASHLGRIDIAWWMIVNPIGRIPSACSRTISPTERTPGACSRTANPMRRADNAWQMIINPMQRNHNARSRAVSPMVNDSKCLLKNWQSYGRTPSACSRIGSAMRRIDIASSIGY